MLAESWSAPGVSALMPSDLEASVIENISPLIGPFAASSTPKRGSVVKPLNEDYCSHEIPNSLAMPAELEIFDESGTIGACGN